MFRLVLQFPVLEAAVLGATVSVRLNSEVGGEYSIFNLANLGSSTSLNSFARFGSSVSVLRGLRVFGCQSTTGLITVGLGLSVKDSATVGRSLSTFGGSVVCGQRETLCYRWGFKRK